MRKGEIIQYKVKCTNTNLMVFWGLEPAGTFRTTQARTQRSYERQSSPVHSTTLWNPKIYQSYFLQVRIFQTRLIQRRGLSSPGPTRRRHSRGALWYLVRVQVGPCVSLPTSDISHGSWPRPVTRARHSRLSMMIPTCVSIASCSLTNWMCEHHHTSWTRR